MSNNFINMIISIQFIKGINEETIPTIRLTRSRDGSTATAIFNFEEPSLLTKSFLFKNQITGLYLIDNLNILSTNDLHVRFINGRPHSIEAIFVFKTNETYERFIRFMQNYASQNSLSFKG